MTIELDKSDIRIYEVRDAVLAALDEVALRIYRRPLFGWKDAELPDLFKAIDQHAERIAQRAAEATEPPLPLFPIGSLVTSHKFRDPDVPKRVISARWDGAEYEYRLVDVNGTIDEGYYTNHLKRWEA